MQQHFNHKVDDAAKTLAAGLSRRSLLRVLAGGTVGGLLAEIGAGSTPVQAQTIYLPSMLNGNTSVPSGELCSADPECAEEECCVDSALLDFGWFRTHLLDKILPHWLAAVTSQGLFLPHFDRQWRPLNLNFGTLVSQGRLLYCFAQGYALTGDQRYRDAVAGGAQYLLSKFRDPQYGGWYWACNLDGTVRDKRKDSYGHAFALFGLAHAYECTGNTAFQTAMLETWDVIKTRFKDSYGGLNGRMTQDFQVTGTTKEQNPVMHTFEALLAAGTVGGQPQLLQEARTLGNFVLDKLVRPADRRLPEKYDLAWKELTAANGGQLVIGHAFEWAYLAAHATELGLPARFLTYANNFLTYGMALGYDWQAGGIYSPTRPDGVIINQQKGWWEQCETIRALIHFYLRQHRTELNGPLQRAIEFIKASFIDPQYGGWYQRVGPGVAADAMNKGNEWKVDYHVVGMCMEAIRLTSQTASQ